MKRQNLLYILLGALITPQIYILSTFYTFSHLRSKRDERVEKYVENDLENIMQELETEMGIEFTGRPKLEFMSSKQLGIYVDIDTDIALSGLYKKDTDTIYLASGLLTIPEFNINDSLAWFFTLGNTADVRGIAAHELGHFYANQLSKGMEEGIWEFGEEPTPRNFSLKLVGEGIGIYFERIITKENDDFEDSDWPEDITKNFTFSVCYDGGYHLVKPIIDEFGKKGIKYLMLHLPNEQEFKNLSGYQRNVLNKLAEKED